MGEAYDVIKWAAGKHASRFGGRLSRQRAARRDGRNKLKVLVC